MKRILYCVVIAFLFSLLLSSCSKSFTPQDPKSALEDSSFIVDPKNTMCPGSEPVCITYKYDAGSFFYWAMLYPDDKLILGFVVSSLSPRSTLRLQYNFLNYVLKKIYPSDVVKQVMAAVKNNESDKGSSENISWGVNTSYDDHFKWNEFRVFFEKK
jgi:hypothetical protein